MHYKTRQKLISTSKIYLTIPERDKGITICHEIRLQLPTKEYVFFELHQPIPKRPHYNDLSNGGFNSIHGDGITHYGKWQAIRILNASKGYRNNDDSTIDTLIALIGDMGHI